MDIVAFTLHLLGFLLPAPCVALGTTLAARWRAGAPARLRWWMQWLLCCAAGMASLVGGLWLSGHDGRMASYAALVLVCATVSWGLTLPARG